MDVGDVDAKAGMGMKMGAQTMGATEQLLTGSRHPLPELEPSNTALCLVSVMNKQSKPERKYM